MSDFKQAIKWLREGKKVRRSSWGNKTLYGEIKANNFISFEDERGDTNAHFLNDAESLEATDWEIYEKESLSGNICEFKDERPEGNTFIFTRDVRQKIQKAQRRLKKAFPEVINIEELMTSLHPTIIINTIFKEEFGDKLIE